MLWIGLAGAPGIAAETESLGTHRAGFYQAALREGRIDELSAHLATVSASADGPRELESLAAVLGAMGDSSLPTLRTLLENQPRLDPAVTAELLWRISVQGRLTDAQAALAASLLAHEDPFVRALAEWAIATRVGMDNNGQVVAWPRPDPPEWYRRWTRLPPEFLVEADYARFAIVWNIHYDAGRMASSGTAILARARGAAREIQESGSEDAPALAARQLQQLESIAAALAERAKSSPNDLLAQRRSWLDARRAARPIVLANPAVDFHQIVLVKHYPAHSHRNITGSQYPWVHKPGGDVFVQAGLEPGSPARAVIAGQLGPGHVHGIDLWWDADRLVFGYAKQPNWPPKWDAVHGNDSFWLRTDQQPTHLFEIRLDGSGLKQLTDHPYWSDLEPTYCANGEIVFASDRSGRSSECGNFHADHTVVNLYAVSPDGSNPRRLSDNKDIDRYPHSLDNGLLAYTRWEYQERHFLEVHSIWTIRPDGTMADAVFDQHLKWPCGFRDTRSVPGGSKLVSIASGHHTFAYGPVVVVDPLQGISVPEAIRILTPGVVPQEGGMSGSPVPEGGVPDQGGLYQTPWALSERCFLVSYSFGRPSSDTAGGNNENGFALYLIDAYGNKELIHRDLLLSASAPMPLKPRPRPPVLPDMTDRSLGYATCYLQDVYRGLDGVPRGTVKHLRISQRVGWPLDEKIGAMRWIPGNAWEKHLGFHAWAPVRVIGTVPVAPDGSAHFKVPVDLAVYFQALDEDHMELRRMRSHVTFQPGEQRGCVGCHETQLKTPPPGGPTAAALAQEPAVPTPPPWGATRLLGYEWLVQPIFDRHCLRCHAHDHAEGGIDLSARRADDGLNQSFHTLFGHYQRGGKQGEPLVSVSNRFSGAGVTRIMEFGSHKSRLATVLRDDELHRKEAPLSRPEWIALVTWIDASAPYYDTFYNRRPADGGPPCRDVFIELPDPFACRPQ